MTLLHTCCGPCASACVPRLKGLNREVTMFFANSNIDTREEYEKRLAAARQLAEAEGVPLVALPYDHEEWRREVAAGYEREPEKGARCARCFRYNLAKTAEYARQHGFDEFTTSLTISPHKVSKVILAIGASVQNDQSRFLPEDFKKREGFKLSTRRAAELGLYRQSYCGCEYSKLPRWKIHHQTETVSTNLDAKAGRPWDVFTADYQSAGRGRLDHKWQSPPGTNLMMSAVLPVEGLAPDHVATLPLVIGLAVARGLSPFLRGLSPVIKWPNDVWGDGRKISGILCERQGDLIIAGIGVNVGQRAFPPEIAEKATSLSILTSPNGVCPPGAEGGQTPVSKVRDSILYELGRLYGQWRDQGFAAIYPQLIPLDFLRGQTLSVYQTDHDQEPITGHCEGIQPDGSLKVADTSVYAGEAHIAGIES